MIISDGNLRELSFRICAHSDTWWDDSYSYKNTISNESRLMFVMQGEINYEIFGKTYTVSKNHMLLIPSRHNFSLFVPQDGYVHIQYCNFNAVLDSDSILDYLDGDWVAEISEPHEIIERFKRFHRTDKDNLIMDCLEKRINLLYLLSRFIQSSRMKTAKSKTCDGDELNGIAQYIKHYDGPHTDLTTVRLAKMINFHPNYFISLFKKRFGVTPMSYVSNIYRKRAEEYLSSTDLSIGIISERLTFPDQKSFSKFFKRQTGITPSEFRKQSKSE